MSSSRSRDGRIRTGDPLNPIQVRYRAAPRPEKTNAEYNRGGEGTQLGGMGRGRGLRCLRGWMEVSPTPLTPPIGRSNFPFLLRGGAVW
jgi:hypothetical protein